MVPDPDKIFCMGFNYAAHTQEMSFKRPVARDIFAKFRNGLTGDQADVELPVCSVQADCEGGSEWSSDAGAEWRAPTRHSNMRLAT